MNFSPISPRVVKIKTYLRAVRHKKKILAALGLVLTIILPMELIISGEFDVYPKNNADIRAPVEAVISVIYVKEGDRVRKGDALFQLTNPDLEVKRQDIRSLLSAAKARYGLLIAGTRHEEVLLMQKEVETAQTRLKHAVTMLDEAKRIHNQKINQAQQSVSLAKDQLTFTLNERDRYALLLKKNIISKQRFAEFEQAAKISQGAVEDSQTSLSIVLADDLGEARREKALATSAHQEAKAKLALLQADSRIEDIDAAKSAVASLEVQLSLINNDFDNMKIQSPEDGIVVTEHLHDLHGKLVHRGDLIVEIYDFRIVKAELLIPEKEIGDVTIGQGVTLKARAYPGRSFKGKVVAIAPRAISSADGLNRKMIRVTTEISNPDLALMPGMTGYGKINAGDRSIFDIITRRMVRYFRVEFWSWW